LTDTYKQNKTEKYTTTQKSGLDDEMKEKAPDRETAVELCVFLMRNM